MSTLGIIAALAKNGVIGKNGRIPWHITGEQSRFKQLTNGNVVIMGRKTYEEIGNPLSDRQNIVLSSTTDFSGESLHTCRTLQDALHYAQSAFPQCDIFIAGGAALYAEALPYSDVLFLTEIDAIIDGDVFFPKFDLSLFTKSCGEYLKAELPYRYVTYTRKR